MIEAVRNNVQAMLPPTQHAARPANLSLHFNRLCRAIDEQGEVQNKQNTVSALVNGYSSEAMQLYRLALNQWRRTMEDAPDSLCFSMKTTSPLVVGKGDQNVHEFGITLQLPWATPVIPGSAVKGVLSTFAHEQGDENWNKACLAGFSGEHAQLMFGGVDGNQKSSAGCLDFMDAWWVPQPHGNERNKPFIQDIITVHNRSYYQERANAFPNGTEDPLPNEFVVVRPDTEFLFVIRGPLAWCELAREMLKDAAREYGFGAKTRVGYGRLAYRKTLAEIAEAMPDMNDTELMGVFRANSTNAELAKAFCAQAEARACTKELEPLFRKFRPFHLFRLALEQGTLTVWKDVRNIYNDFKGALDLDQIDTKDPDVQAIYTLCVPLAENLPDDAWLWRFAPTADDLIAGKDINSIEQVLQDYISSSHFPAAAFREAIQNREDLDEVSKDLLLDIIDDLEESP